MTSLDSELDTTSDTLKLTSDLDLALEDEFGLRVEHEYEIQRGLGLRLELGVLKLADILQLVSSILRYSSVLFCHILLAFLSNPSVAPPHSLDIPRLLSPFREPSVSIPQYSASFPPVFCRHSSAFRQYYLSILSVFFNLTQYSVSIPYCSASIFTVSRQHLSDSASIPSTFGQYSSVLRPSPLSILSVFFLRHTQRFDSVLRHVLDILRNHVAIPTVSIVSGKPVT